MSLNDIVISGVLPFSCNDYPKEISYVIFLGGCNFRCPYCHNSSIVNKSTIKIKIKDLLKDLNERKKIISAVVISGGEPTIYNESLIKFIKIIKDLGFKIKLDTNGTNPILIKKILDLKLVDYIAMDVKNTYEKYNATAGTKVNIENIRKSINLIENSKINYEFRTTISKTFHNINDIKKIKKYFKKPNKFIIQNYQYNKEQLVNINYQKFTEEELNKLNKKTL